VVAIGDAGSAGRRARDRGPEAVALGLLGDLVGHRERELLQRTGLVLHCGELGAWLVGEQGAFLVRSRGRRVDCWCVGVGEQNQAPQQRRGSATPRLDLPSADRAAHLVLALREDELGFAKVANLGFSGARWRVRRNLGERARIALDEAAQAARASSS
jgi:hypothetical protein